MANRSERRSWDSYVREAKEVYSEIDLGDEVIRVYIPSSNAMDKIGATDDQWTQLAALLGEENCARLREVAGDAPVTALQKLVEDVFADLGLSDNSGE